MCFSYENKLTTAMASIEPAVPIEHLGKPAALRYGYFSKSTLKSNTCAVLIRIIFTFAN